MPLAKCSKKLIAAIAICSLAATMCLGAFASSAFAVTAAEKQAEAEAALANLNSLQKDLDKASSDYFTAKDELKAAEQKVEKAQKRIDEATKEIDNLQEKLGTRARSMYRSGSTTFLDIVLGSATFEEFATNWDLLNQMNENDAEMVQKTKTLRKEVEDKKVELEKQQKICEEKTAEAKKIKKEAQKLVDAMQETYDSLSAEAAELLEQERAAQNAAAQAAAIAELENQASSDNSSSSGSKKKKQAEPDYDSLAAGDAVSRAYNYVGNGNYVWGACSPGKFDCSGFVSYCLTGEYSRIGTTYTFLGWEHTKNPQPGDICVNEGHCGIYIGDGQMIHAASPGEGIVVGPVQSGMVYVRG